MPKLAQLTEVVSEPVTERKRIEDVGDEPFRILVLGDFSARNHRAVFEPGQLGWRMPIPVGLETIESVMLRLAPSLSLLMPGMPRKRVDLPFAHFSDFLPHHIHERVEAQAPTGPDQAEAAVRYLIHHPDFQGLESVWRCLFFLLLYAGTGADIRVSLLDVTKQELADDLCSAADICDSGFYRLLVGHSGMRAAHPWTMCVSDYSFSPHTIEDIETLTCAAKVARHAGVPFLGAVRHDWPGEPGLAWQLLRESPEAAYLGLATPRFLVRQPLQSSADDEFPFVEMPGEPALEDYLWGNPAFVCAAVLVDAYRREGWRMETGEWAELEGFFKHEYVAHRENRCTLPVETEFAEQELTGLLDRGVIPLTAAQDGTVIRFPRLQSVRKPSTPLRGRW